MKARRCNESSPRNDSDSPRLDYFRSAVEQELDFKRVLALPYPRATKQMERLNSTGNPSAMAYALAGMRKLG